MPEQVRTRKQRRVSGGMVLIALPLAGALALGGWSLASIASTDESDEVASCPIATPTIGHTLSPSTVGTVYDVPATIDATGTREVSTELQSWLVGTVQSGTPDRPNLVRFQSGGRYWVDYTLTLRKQSGGIAGAMWPDLPKFTRDNLRIDLNGATLEQRTTQGYKKGTVIVDARKRWGDPILFTGGATGVEITNGTISGANPIAKYQAALEEWAGIKISGNRNDGVPIRAIWVHNVAINHVFGDFIYISAGTSAGDTITDLLIEDNRMTVAGRQGIVLNGGTNLVIRRNDIRNTAHLNFDSEPTVGQGWQDVTITENTGNASPLGYFQFSGPSRATASNIHIIGNTITNGNFRVKVGGRITDPRRCFEFSDNHNLGTAEYTRSVAYKHLVRVAYWDGVTIHHNLDRVHPPGEVVAVDLEGSLNTSVTQNTWVDALDNQCPDGVCPEP
jgi:hypothetical protein